MGEEGNIDWNRAAQWYDVYASKMTSILYYTYMHVLKLNEAKNILEIACGTGNGIPIILNFANKHAKITATDLSEEMVKISLSKNFDRTEITVADSESLPFESERFDRYIANLSLMLVHNPEHMLSEAYRVLQPGGIAAFSVLGNESDCTMSNLLFIIERLNVNGRGPYHFNDLSVLRPMVLRAGFRQILCFNTVVPFPSVDEDEIYNCLLHSPQGRKMANRSNFNEIMGRVAGIIRKTLRSGKTLNLAGLVAIAFK